MIETTGFALASLAYSVVVSSGSMATAAYFNSIDSLDLGHALTLIVWCGGGIGLLAYAKQKLGTPAFNTACSLACMVIFVNLVRDGFGKLCKADVRERTIGAIQRGVYSKNFENRSHGRFNIESCLLYRLATICYHEIKVCQHESQLT